MDQSGLYIRIAADALPRELYRRTVFWAFLGYSKFRTMFACMCKVLMELYIKFHLRDECIYRHWVTHTSVDLGLSNAQIVSGLSGSPAL